MNLQEFVKNVLIDLDKAVGDARNTTSHDIRFSGSTDTRTVEFDIAVSVEESDSQSGKAGVRVLQFVEGGGEIARENKNSTVSRIKFGVYVAPKTKDETARWNASNR